MALNLEKVAKELDSLTEKISYKKGTIKKTKQFPTIPIHYDQIKTVKEEIKVLENQFKCLKGYLNSIAKFK